MVLEKLPTSYRDLEEIRHAIKTLQDVIEDLPQVYRSLGAALDLQYRNNALDSTHDVIDVEQALKSAQTALSAAATKAAEIAVEHQVVLHALELVAEPACAPESARTSRA